MLGDWEWLALIWVDILFIPDKTLDNSIKENKTSIIKDVIFDVLCRSIKNKTQL